MKIKIIVPINSSAYNDLVLEDVKKVKSTDTQIDIQNITQGNAFIQSLQDNLDNAPYAAALISKAEQDGYDAVYVCDMDMCGVELAKSQGVKILVHGGFSSNMPLAAKRGNFAIITLAESVIKMQQKFVNLYADGKCLGLYTTGLNVHDLYNDDRIFDILYQKCCQVIQKHKQENIRSIIFGCSGFVNFADRLNLALKDNDCNVKVFDPNKTAIKLIQSELLQLKQ